MNEKWWEKKKINGFVTFFIQKAEWEQGWGGGGAPLLRILHKPTKTNRRYFDIYFFFSSLAVYFIVIVIA